MAALNDCVCQHVGYCDGSCQHPEPVSATTSAGVTEEQTPRIRPLPQVGEEAETYRKERGPQWTAIFDALRDYTMSNMCWEDGLPGYPLVDRLSREGDGVTIADGEWEMVNIADEIMSALEASRVDAPVSQKEAVAVGYLEANYERRLSTGRIATIYAERAQPTDVAVFLAPAPAPAGEPGIKALAWEYHERPVRTYVTKGYYINQSFGSDSFYFATVRMADGAVLYDGDDLPSAKAAAQVERDAYIRSALVHPNSYASLSAVGVEAVMVALEDAVDLGRWVHSPKHRAEVAQIVIDLLRSPAVEGK